MPLAGWSSFASRISARDAVVIALAIGLACVHPRAVDGVLVALGFLALLGPCAAVICLSLAVVLCSFNPALVELTPQALGLRWVVVLAAAVRLLFATRLRAAAPLVPLFCFSLVAAITSLIGSLYPSVSMLKLATFTFVVAALLGGIRSLDAEHSWRLQRWFFTLALVLLLLSLLTLASPAIAFKTNQRGFQGVLAHPQTFGIVMAPFAAWIAAELLLARRGGGWRDALILAPLLATMIASQARVAAGALVASTAATAALVYLRLSFASVRRPAPITAVLGLLATALLGMSFLALDSLSHATQSFLRKGSRTEGVIAALDASRGHLARSQWKRFLQRPLTGHGFGVPAGGQGLNVTTFLGVPVSASVEKGVTATAALEEVGILGFAAAAAFVLTLLAKVLRSRDFRWHAVFFACLLVNAGEAVFFSVGGPGLFFWPLMALALAPAQGPSAGSQPA